MSDQQSWDCEAYGPEGRTVGALCFFADEWERVCATAADCAAAMHQERRRVHGRFVEMAAAGDPVAQELARTFTDPDHLLGGPLAHEVELPEGSTDDKDREG